MHSVEYGVENSVVECAVLSTVCVSVWCTMYSVEYGMCMSVVYNV